MLRGIKIRFFFNRFIDNSGFDFLNIMFYLLQFKADDIKLILLNYDD